jgi:hypothetical protein
MSGPRKHIAAIIENARTRAGCADIDSNKIFTPHDNVPSLSWHLVWKEMADVALPGKQAMPSSSAMFHMLLHKVNQIRHRVKHYVRLKSG